MIEPLTFTQCPQCLGELTTQETELQQCNSCHWGKSIENAAPLEWDYNDKELLPNIIRR